MDNTVNYEPKPSYVDILIGECGTNNPKDSNIMNNKSRSSKIVKPIFFKDENLFCSVKPEQSQ